MNLDSIFPANNPILILVILVWSMFWKGLALWRSSKNSQRNWFIVMLVISSLGILEIVYLFRFATKRLTIKEIKSWVKK